MQLHLSTVAMLITPHYSFRNLPYNNNVFLLTREGYYFDPATALTNIVINLPSERTLAQRSNTGPLSMGSYKHMGLDPIQLSPRRRTVV